MEKIPSEMDLLTTGSIKIYSGQPIDTNDKGAWCTKGEQKEKEFIQRYGNRLNLIINPKKKWDRYAPDLFNTRTELVADLKTKNTPFFTVKAFYGLDPHYTVEFNCKDRANYAENYPEIEIYFWVDWPTTQRGDIQVGEMNGVWVIPFEELNVMLDSVPIWEHRNRKKGNAKDGYLIDLRKLKQVM